MASQISIVWEFCINVPISILLHWICIYYPKLWKAEVGNWSQKIHRFCKTVSHIKWVSRKKYICILWRKNVDKIRYKAMGCFWILAQTNFKVLRSATK